MSNKKKRAKKEKDLSLVIPKLASFLSKGTDTGNIILMLQNAGFDISFEAFNNSRKSKQGFIHELFISEHKSKNFTPFIKLADLMLVEEYFRPGEYDYVYNEDEAKELSHDLKNSIKGSKNKEKITERRFRELLFGFLSLHKGINTVSKHLFVGGNYEQATSEACKFFENYVQDKMGSPSLIGVELMSAAFKKENPILSLYVQPMDAKQKNEQEGFHLLSIGEVKYIKNRLSHRRTGTIVKTRSSCLKILSFISLLLEQVDSMYFSKEKEISSEAIPF